MLCQMAQLMVVCFPQAFLTYSSNVHFHVPWRNIKCKPSAFCLVTKFQGEARKLQFRSSCFTTITFLFMCSLSYRNISSLDDLQGYLINHPGLKALVHCCGL